MGRIGFLQGRGAAIEMPNQWDNGERMKYISNRKKLEALELTSSLRGSKGGCCLEIEQVSVEHLLGTQCYFLSF